MSERSWFSIRTTTSWSKLLVASEWIVRGTAESPGATRGTTLHATTARAATRIEAAITRNACGRPMGGIKGTSERCPHPNPRYMPTRGRLSILVTAMRNTHVRGTNEKSMLEKRSPGLPIRRIVFFLFLFFVLLHGVAARPRAGSGLPAVRAADHQGGHEPQDHDEQGEGPRDSQGEGRERERGRLDVEMSLGRRCPARVVDRLDLDGVRTVEQVPRDRRHQADGLERPAVDADFLPRDPGGGTGGRP